MLVRELHSEAQFDAIEAGPERDLVVVFIHGALDRSAGMARLAREASTAARTVRYDRRGYGDRWEHPGPFDVEGHVDDVQAIVADRECILIGHSYGGHVALAAAARMSGQTRGVSTYESPLAWLDWWPRDTAGRQATSSEVDVAAERFMVAMIGVDAWNRLPERTREHRRREGRALVAELSDLGRGTPWRPENVSCRVLCGVRTNAPEHHARASIWMRDSLPHADIAEFEGAGHGAHLTHAGMFHQLLVAPHLREAER